MRSENKKIAIDQCDIIVSKEEKKLLELLRSIQYGQFVVYMQAGKPVRIESIKESIVL